jgi:mono/diheme cytochrome c family protein
MFFFKLSLVFLTAILFVAACSNSEVSQNPANTGANAATGNSASIPNAAPVDELAATRELYSKNCVNCHKETGEGGRKEIDGEKIKVPNFKDPRVSAEKDDEYIKHIEKGGDGMPAYKGKISDEEIKNLVSFIRRDFQGKQ